MIVFKLAFFICCIIPFFWILRFFVGQLSDDLVKQRGHRRKIQDIKDRNIRRGNKRGYR